MLYCAVLQRIIGGLPVGGVSGVSGVNGPRPVGLRVLTVQVYAKDGKPGGAVCLSRPPANLDPGLVPGQLQLWAES